MLGRKQGVQLGGPGDPDLYRPSEVLISLDASLQRLQTDYVDLYYAHRDYPELPIEQIVEAFDGAAKSGKVREIGASNFSAERLSAALDAADASGAAPFTVLQNQYNLVARGAYGRDLQRLCLARGIAMLPFFGLASGYLTGKYRKPEDFAQGNRSHRRQGLRRGRPPDPRRNGPHRTGNRRHLARDRARLACAAARNPRPDRQRAHRRAARADPGVRPGSSSPMISSTA